MVLDHEFDDDVESSSSDEEENESLKAMKERLLRSKKNRPKSPTPSADFREGDTVSVLYENKRCVFVSYLLKKKISLKLTCFLRRNARLVGTTL